MAENKMDVSTFLANFQGGGLRPNRFKVVMTFPQEAGGQAAATKVSFTCKSATVPPSTLGVATPSYQGRQAKIPGDREFQPWNITIMLDTDFINRDAFEKWSDAMNGHASNVAMPGWSNPSRTFATAEVYLLGAEGNTLRKYVLHGAWPSNVGEVQLGWDQNNQIAEMPVTMEYQYWTSDAVADAT